MKITWQLTLLTFALLSSQLVLPRMDTTISQPDSKSLSAIDAGVYAYAFSSNDHSPRKIKILFNGDPTCIPHLMIKQRRLANLL